MASKKRRSAAPIVGARASTEGSTQTRLVYIHGIGWQEPLQELRHLWDVALFGRSIDESAPTGPSRMARWSDVVRDDEPRRAWASRVDGHDSGTFDLEAELEACGLDPEDDRVADLFAGLLQNVDASASRGTRKKLVPLPGFLRRPLARAFLKSLVGDVAKYLFDEQKRRQVRARLEAELPDGNAEDVVLVSHSWGTVIALEVLAARAEAGNPVSVRSFVTLGSPLGIREVQDFLECPLAVPPGVRQWLNFADPLDAVALDKGLANDFAARIDDDHREVAIDDSLIVNQRTIHGNPHAAVGYLAHPKVRRPVAEAARFDTMARFVVARDVAEGLADPTQRQPVLIEIREPASTEEATSLRERGEKLKSQIADIVRETSDQALVESRSDDPLETAQIDVLQRFVSARLLPHELLRLAADAPGLHVHAVWKSSRKKKFVAATARALQADASQISYRAFGNGVRWAVLDTGVQADHPHFQQHGNIKKVWDCTKRGKPVELLGSHRSDRDGHGTHVCGILSGQESDGPRRGLAPRAELHVYKVLDNNGEGEDAWIIKALDHIAEVNAEFGEVHIHGINLSLGGPFDSSVFGCGYSPLCRELRRLWRDGVLVVVASGNEGKVAVAAGDGEGEVELNSPMSIGDPANLEECIAVGSVHKDKPHLYGVSPFSSRGPTADGRGKPDVVAPGERIESCNHRWAHAQPYREESGTSMASPAVSGMLAAFLSVRSEFRGRPDEVKSLLLRTCTDLQRDRYHQGHGMPNLMRMLLES